MTMFPLRALCQRRAGCLSGLLGVPFFAAGIYLMVAKAHRFGPVGALFFMLTAALLMLFAAILWAPVIAGKIGDFLGFSVFLPRIRGPIAPEYSLIHGLIARQEYAEAQAALEAKLDANPGNPELIRMLFELLMDKMRDTDSAVGLLAVYFERDRREPEDADLALRLADIYFDLGQAESARLFLLGELARDYLKGPAEKEIVRRLEALEPNKDGTTHGNP